MIQHHQQVGDGVRPRTFLVTVDNAPGVLARVVGLISARAWNIPSLTVFECENPDVAIITLKFMATDTLAEQVANQFGRLVPVHRAEDLSDNPDRIEIQAILLKIVVDSKHNPVMVTRLAEDQHHAYNRFWVDRVLIFSKTGTAASCSGFVNTMKQYGTVVTNGSGVVALA